MIRNTIAQSLILNVVALLIGTITLLEPLAAPAQQTNATTSGVVDFKLAGDYDSGGQLAWTLAVADVNGDGKPDVLVLNNNGESGSGDGSVGVLLGNGDGSFQRTVVYDSGGVYASGFAVGDLNRDGKPDLVVASDLCAASGPCLGVLLGNGDGTFQTATIYPRGAKERFSGEGIYIPVIIADVNGDGKPDLVVVSQTDNNYGDGSVGVLLGNGDGTFKEVVTYDTGGFGAFSGVVMDINGDGKADLVVLNCSPRGSSDCNHNAIVGVLLGNGDGTFKAATTYDSGGLGGTSALAVADVNGDDKPDVIVGNNAPCSPICSSGSFGVLLGKGDGTFQGVVAYDLGSVAIAESIAIADLNGDGKMDLVVAGGAVGVWLGKGDGTFQLSNAYSNTGGTGQLFLADLDHDGNLDVLGVNGTSNSADVRLGNGDGTFRPIQTFSLGGTQYSWATIADVNRDGLPEILSANWCSPSCSGEEGTVGVLLNNTPFCTAAPVITLSATPTSLWPPNGEIVPVTVSGTITDTGCTITNAAYAIKDEYGEVQPTGPVTLGPGGAYSFTVLLQASRLGADLDGRLYTVTVRASNSTDNTGSQVDAVIVPHDQGH